MNSIMHTGNTAMVGWTCFTADSVTPFEARALRDMGARCIRSSHVGVFERAIFDVRIADWPTVHAYLFTLLTLSDKSTALLPFFPTYATHYSISKHAEWKKHFPEIPDFSGPRGRKVMFADYNTAEEIDV